MASLHCHCSARFCSHTGPSRGAPAGARFPHGPTQPLRPLYKPGPHPGAALSLHNMAEQERFFVRALPSPPTANRKHSSVGGRRGLPQRHGSPFWDTAPSPAPEEETQGKRAWQKCHRWGDRNRFSSGSAHDRAQGQQGRLPGSRVWTEKSSQGKEKKAEEIWQEKREGKEEGNQLWGTLQVPGRVSSVLSTARPAQHCLRRPPGAPASPVPHLPELTSFKHRWRQTQQRRTKGQDFTFRWSQCTRNRGENSQLLGI